jgi:phospholipid transport system transporter-binding protein
LAQASIESVAAGELAVSGELVFASAAELLQRGDKMIAGESPLTIDLAAVGDCDSAGLALLLEWLDLGRQRDIVIRYRNTPAALLGIARLSNVVDLIKPQG